MLDEFSEYLLEARVNTSADFDTYAVSYTNLLPVCLCIKLSVMNKKFTRKPRKNCFAEFYNFDSPEVLSLMSKVICKVLKNSEVYFDLTQKLFL